MTQRLERHFVSFPKSGRTWIRYAFVRMGLTRYVEWHHDGFGFCERSRPPLNLDFQERLTRYQGDRRTIYLHRDPRDVMVSFFHQIKGRYQDVHGYEGTISDFLRDPYFGAVNLKAFHVQWMEICRRGHAMCVSYEECHSDFLVTLRAILSYFELDVADASLQQACEASTFNRMKEVERSNRFPGEWLRLRNGYPKIRRGAVSNYLEELNEDDIRYLNDLFFVANLG